jgi:hypothetical protein
MKADVDASRSKEVVEALQSRKQATGVGFHWYLSQPLARWAGSKEHVAILVQMAGDRTDRARAEALQHLIRLDAEKAIDLVDAKSDDTFLRMFFGQTLQGMGPEGEAIALRLLSREKHEVIALGLQFLRTSGTPKAIPQIQQLAQKAQKNNWTLIQMQAKSAITMIERRASGSR